jgi:hypothetical protein
MYHLSEPRLRSELPVMPVDAEEKAGEQRFSVIMMGHRFGIALFRGSSILSTFFEATTLKLGISSLIFENGHL